MVTRRRLLGAGVAGLVALFGGVAYFFVPTITVSVWNERDRPVTVTVSVTRRGGDQVVREQLTLDSNEHRAIERVQPWLVVSPQTYDLNLDVAAGDERREATFSWTQESDEFVDVRIYEDDVDISQSQLL